MKRALFVEPELSQVWFWERMMMEGIHGGDIYRKDVTVDFSVNVNPLGIPEAVKAALHDAVGSCDRYPDIAGEKLKKAVSGMLGVPEKYLLFGNGASELFMACVHGIRPERTVIPMPSFYGYEYAARASGGEVVYYRMGGETGFRLGEEFFPVLTQDTELLFLANPGNPSGTVMSREYLGKLLSYCRDKGIYVVLDECFIEFCKGNCSMLDEVEIYENLILVRAFTKIFAIPGVRLGYLVCSDQRLLGKIAGQLPEWNLSVFAQAAGCACAVHKEFPARTADYVAEERQFLAEGLKKSGVCVVSGEANFLLIYSKTDLYGRLLDRGILIRDCGNFRGLSKGFYRIAVKSREENAILLKNIGEIIWTDSTG